MAAGTWITIPTFNEVENIERIVRAVVAQLEATAPRDHQLLIVDDDSPDGTGNVAERLAGELDAVSVMHRGTKDGLGRAYLAGLEAALAGGAERVVIMDADFSHDPAYLPALIAATESDCDLALGSRYVAGGRVDNWPPVRRVLSRAGSLYARSILGVHVRDLTGGYRCVRREVLERLELGTLRSQGYVFNIELTYRALRAGFRVKEVPIVFRDRADGVSKMSLPIAIEALMLVPQLRRAPGAAAVPAETGGGAPAETPPGTKDPARA